MAKPRNGGGDSSWLILPAIVVATLSLGSTLYLYGQNVRLRAKLSGRRVSERPKARASDKGNISTSTQSAHSSKNASFIMKDIGIVHSPFPQRAGCPRQGTLAPHVRSHLILHPSYSQQIVDGLEKYSHVWIIFAFHLNPRGKAKGQGSKSSFTAQKIKPPRSPTKIGVLASRAPHRPNPVGLSLCLLEDVMTISIQGRKHITLVLRGLDLVDGTPVYDVKPYVPWDRIDQLGDDGGTRSGLLERMKHVKVPSWVLVDDELAQVKWSGSARKALEYYMHVLAPLYTIVDDAINAISEIVAQDPRAVRDGRGKTSNETFDFTFGQLRVSFSVQQNDAEIIDVVVDNGDATALPGSYPYNLAQRRFAEMKSGKSKLHWANPVREGVTDGLFELRDGTKYDLNEATIAKLPN